MGRERWLLATHNPGKLRELANLLEDVEIELVGAAELELNPPEEHGLTFVENALHKARTGAAETHLPTIADDSGLAVTALDGAPGIYSARYAGPGANDQDNRQLLLKEMADVPEPRRLARFVCALVALRHAEDPVPLFIQTEWWGQIAIEPRGEGGFGYDPIFWLPELGCTAAELSAADKNRLSHRGQAARALRQALGQRRG